MVAVPVDVCPVLLTRVAAGRHQILMRDDAPGPLFYRRLAALGILCYEVAPPATRVGELAPGLVVCLQAVAIAEPVPLVAAGRHEVLACDDSAGPFVDVRVAALGELPDFRGVV